MRTKYLTAEEADRLMSGRDVRRRDAAIVGTDYRHRGHQLYKARCADGAIIWHYMADSGRVVVVDVC